MSATTWKHAFVVLGPENHSDWELSVHILVTEIKIFVAIILILTLHIPGHGSSHSYPEYTLLSWMHVLIFVCMCVCQCVSLKLISAVRSEPPTTVSGPRWPPSGRTSSRTRTGWDAHRCSCTLTKPHLCQLTCNPPISRCRCLISGWKETSLCLLNVTSVIRRVAVSSVCRTGGVSGVKPWWDHGPPSPLLPAQVSHKNEEGF